MTNTPQIFALKKRLDMSEDNFPYKLPRLAKYNSLDKDWYCEYYIYDAAVNDLKRKRIVLNETTKAERLRVYKIYEKEVIEMLKEGYIMNANRLPKQKAPVNTLFNAIEFFLKFNEKIIKASTIRSYTTQLNRLQEYFLKDKKILASQINEDMALQFADWLTTVKQIGNRTRNNNINALITVFNFLQKRKIINKNPFLGISMLPTVARSHTAFMPKEVIVFKDHCKKDEQLWLFCQFMYYVFVRPREELRHLKIGDISEKTIVIHYGTAKNRKTEHVMIPKPLELIIEKYMLRSYPAQHYIFGKSGVPSDTPTYYHQLYRRHANILQQCGLIGKNIDMYSWKHTGVIALWKATQNIQLIREQCRHSDLISTMKYLRDLGLFTDYEQIDKFPEI